MNFLTFRRRKKKILLKLFKKIIHYRDKNKKMDKFQRSVPTGVYLFKKEKRKKEKKKASL